MAMSNFQPFEARYQRSGAFTPLQYLIYALIRDLDRLTVWAVFQHIINIGMTEEQMILWLRRN